MRSSKRYDGQRESDFSGAARLAVDIPASVIDDRKGRNGAMFWQSGNPLDMFNTVRRRFGGRPHGERIKPFIQLTSGYCDTPDCDCYEHSESMDFFATHKATPSRLVVDRQRARCTAISDLAMRRSSDDSGALTDG